MQTWDVLLCSACVNKITIITSTNESTAKHRHENAGPWKVNCEDKLSATKETEEVKMEYIYIPTRYTMQLH